MRRRKSTQPVIGEDLFTAVREISDESVPPEPVAPERIGRYELAFKLASGGMADIYLARDVSAPRASRVVALKRIHRHLVGRPGYRELFLDEARIAFQISHPNVCSVLDFGESQGEYYLAMEYLVGEPLARLMNRLIQDPGLGGDPSATLWLARTIADACAGLHAAHEVRGADGSLLEVVHRDVTPRNLFLNYDGGTKVLDFGIATAQMKSHFRHDDKLRGNLAYMAPEQLVGGPTDRRVDIWGLGVTLWEMVTMRRLFKRDTPMATVLSVTYDRIPPPSEIQPALADELDRIVLKALQRDPEKRWQTADHMGLAIQNFLDAQRVTSGPAELSQWMARVFPFGEARRAQLARKARQR